MAKIVVADDEEKIRILVSDFLESAGHTVLQADDGEVALKLFNEHDDIDLFILDVMMPELDGWATCRAIRQTSEVPIIMLTARSEEFDQIMGFESGTDDYVTKPFSLQVLVKRVDAVLKRASGITSAVASENGLFINSDAYSASLDGVQLDLTLKEFEMLEMLHKTPSRVYTRDQLLNSVWGYDYDGDPRTVDSHIARLRTKLGEWGSAHLKTVYGVGYKIDLN